MKQMFFVAMLLMLLVGDLSDAAVAAPAPSSCQLPLGSGGGAESVPAMRSFFDRVVSPSGAARCCKKTVDVHLWSICLFTNGASSQQLSATVRRQEIDWIWRWDGIVQKTGGRGDLPNGFASALIDSIVHRISREPKALAMLLEIFRHSDGMYAQEIAEHLIQKLRSEPHTFIAQCTIVGRNLDLIERAVALYPELRPELRKTYGIQSGAERCFALEKAFG